MAHEAIHTDANDPLNVTNPEHAQHHIVTPLQYTYVFATLLLFTGITVGAAYVDLKWANPVIALHEDIHDAVNLAQSDLDVGSMSPRENIQANAEILRKLSAATDEEIDAAEKASLAHATNLGY